MKKRVRTDLFMTLSITDKENNAIDLSAVTDLTVILMTTNKITSKKVTPILDSTIGQISFQYTGAQNDTIGVFTGVVSYKVADAQSSTGYLQYYVDLPDLFEIVPTSQQEDATGTSVTGTVTEFGKDGLSAYQIAVKNGTFTGTEAEFAALIPNAISSLKTQFDTLYSSILTILQSV